MTESEYYLAFSVCGPIGPKKFISLLNHFGSAEKAWKAAEGELEKVGVKLKTYESFNSFRQTFDHVGYAKKLKKDSVIFIPSNSKLYPKNLKKLPDPPIGIYARGNTLLLKSKFSIGVVGTRKITSYGKDVTEMLVADLVKADACIISGLALGIDAFAQQVALDNNGSTIAVLACGVNCCTPAENYALYQNILNKSGLVISEYPLSQPPNQGTFLARNRIVASLSDGILIPEAAQGSGSLVTAEWGLTFDKKVFAVPGPITSRTSDGTTELLKKGVKLVSNAVDVLEEFEIYSSNPTGKNMKLKYKDLNTDEKKIISLLENEGLLVDEIAKASKISIQSLMIIISGLELRGIVKSSNGRIYIV